MSRRAVPKANSIEAQCAEVFTIRRRAVPKANSTEAQCAKVSWK